MKKILTTLKAAYRSVFILGEGNPVYMGIVFLTILPFIMLALCHFGRVK